MPYQILSVLIASFLGGSESCHTRYCNKTCQHDHWRRGHKQICKKIHRGGNAEQYYADKKYKEAVAEAVEKCADDTKGQRCYICLEAVHSRTGEGLVRGCACGDRDGVSSPELGVAHVSCLARQAKEMMDDAIQSPSVEAILNGFDKWEKCGLCKQEYHGIVKCALGWACWKTYLGHPLEVFRNNVMYRLGVALYESYSGKTEEALAVFNAHMDSCRRLFPGDIKGTMDTQMCLGNCYASLGRLEEALELQRTYYKTAVDVWGEECENTLVGATGIGGTLQDLGRYGENKSCLPKHISTARRSLGAEHTLTLKLTKYYARALMNDGASSVDDLQKAVTTFEDIYKISHRVFGADHPTSRDIQGNLELARKKLTAFRTACEWFASKPKALAGPTPSTLEDLQRAYPLPEALAAAADRLRTRGSNL